MLSVRIGPLLKLALINLLIFFLLLVVLELVFGGWLDGTYTYYKDRRFFNCPSQKYDHEYCAGASHINQLGDVDGGTAIQIYVNQSGIRVASESDQVNATNMYEYDILNIGDSFMQADEIVFKELFSTRLEEITGKKVLQVGYPSWAPIQYVNFLATNEIRPGAIVNVFVMVNDLAPNYDWSNGSYHKKAISSTDASYYFPELDGKGAWDVYEYNAWKEASVFEFLRKLRSAYAAIISGITVQKYKKLEGNFQKLRENCEELEAFREISPNVYDYIVYTFQESCWPEQFVNEIEIGVDDLKKIDQLVREQGGTLNLFLIPPGWAIEGEALAVKNSPYSNIHESTLITTKYISELLARKSGLAVINLEAVLAMFKKESPEQLLYFPGDGHWTPAAHNKLAIWFAEEAL